MPWSKKVVGVNKVGLVGGDEWRTWGQSVNQVNQDLQAAVVLSGTTEPFCNGRSWFIYAPNSPVPGAASAKGTFGQPRLRQGR